MPVRGDGAGGCHRSLRLKMSFAVEHRDGDELRFICVSRIYECVHEISVLYLFFRSIKVLMLKTLVPGTQLGDQAWSWQRCRDEHASLTALGGFQHRPATAETAQLMSGSSTSSLFKGFGPAKSVQGIYFLRHFPPCSGTTGRRARFGLCLSKATTKQQRTGTAFSVRGPGQRQELPQPPPAQPWRGCPRLLLSVLGGEGDLGACLPRAAAASKGARDQHLPCAPGALLLLTALRCPRAAPQPPCPVLQHRQRPGRRRQPWKLAPDASPGQEGHCGVRHPVEKKALFFPPRRGGSGPGRPRKQPRGESLPTRRASSGWGAGPAAAQRRASVWTRRRAGGTCSPALLLLPGFPPPGGAGRGRLRRRMPECPLPVLRPPGGPRAAAGVELGPGDNSRQACHAPVGQGLPSAPCAKDTRLLPWGLASSQETGPMAVCAPSDAWLPHSFGSQRHIGANPPTSSSAGCSDGPSENPSPWDTTHVPLVPPHPPRT